MDWGQIFKAISLSNIGSWASIIGLVLTIFVLLNIRSIKQFYLFSARVPELLEKLTKHAASISTHQKNYPTTHQELTLELAGVEMVLNSLYDKVNRKTKKSVKKTIDSIILPKTGQASKDEIWSIYIQIHKLITEVEELQSDLKWER